jgi:hypothetical protein
MWGLLLEECELGQQSGEEIIEVLQLSLSLCAHLQEQEHHIPNACNLNATSTKPLSNEQADSINLAII